VSVPGHRGQSRPRDVQDGPGFFETSGEGAATTDAEDSPATSSGRRLVVEADGGSRGNPGPAAYGAVVMDAGTSVVLASEGQPIGVATNNVAEYSGLIAGLEMVRALDPTAEVEVRMDSKLVVEQMAGRWKIKHPAMIPLARRAAALRPPKVTWTWVPREQNKAADALVNLALDGEPVRRKIPGPAPSAAAGHAHPGL
jgi:probable phosphoglycerate mutase